VNVVDVLCALTVLQRGMKDHDGASVYYEADLPPEGTVETVGEVVEDPNEELSGEGDVVDGFEEGSCHGDHDLGRERPECCLGDHWDGVECHFGPRDDAGSCQKEEEECALRWRV